MRIRILPETIRYTRKLRTNEGYESLLIFSQNFHNNRDINIDFKAVVSKHTAHTVQLHEIYVEGE